MGITNQEEQALMDALYGKSYDDRWHYVVSDKDLEEFRMTKIEVDNENND